jgi:hypothetical protein
MAFRTSFKSVVNNMHRIANERAIQENIQMVENYNEVIQDYINDIENILKNTNLVAFNPEQYYKRFYRNSHIDDYQPLVMETESSIKKRVGFIKENKLVEKINPKRLEQRLKSNERFQLEKDKVLADFEKAERDNKKQYDNYVSKIKAKDKIYNSLIDIRKNKYASDDPEEVVEVFKTLNNKLDIDVESIKQVSFTYKDRKALLSVRFLNPQTEISKIKGAKFLKTKWEIKEIYFTNAEFEKLYEKIVFNSLLSTVAKIWYYLKDKIDVFVINGFVNKLNPAIGENEDYYFLSIKLNKGDIPFDKLHLLDSKMFWDSKNAKYKLPLVDTKKVSTYELNSSNMIDLIDNSLSGFDFENLTKDLLENNGFQDILVTQSSGDYGADVIAYKDGIKYAIQCKKYSAKVGVKAVQEVIAARTMYKCHVGVVLTNNYFTPNAEELAEINGILLWDKDKLEELIDNSGLSKGLDKIDMSLKDDELN